MPVTMKALVHSNGFTSVQNLPVPSLTSPTDVLVRIDLCGICRTDIFAARGMLSCAPEVTLGHEFTGEVLKCGEEVSRVSVGERVAAYPLRRVYASSARRYSSLEMMGVHFNGGFAEYIVVDQSLLYVCPQDMSLQRAAYAEPVAASLAALTTSIQPSEQGLVFGEGRIAGLTHAVLSHHGFSNVVSGTEGEPGQYEYVIETEPQRLDEALRLVRDGGLLILKSRPSAAPTLNILELIERGIRVETAHYGSFDGAIELLSDETFEVEHLFGESHALEHHEQLFERLFVEESTKQFFCPLR